MAARVGVVCAHPDDEVLGCGATMARHAALGDEVHVLILAEGITGRDEGRDPAARHAQLAALKQSAQAAADVLGAHSVTFEGFPDNRMDSVDLLDVVKAVERFLVGRSIEAVYTHHAGDLNIDHRITHQAVLTACRPVPGSRVHTLLCFEVPSSTEWQARGSGEPFMPVWFEDASQTLHAKLAALRCYEEEMRTWPHPRSYEGVDALARWRGASVGLPAAEAFELVRRIR